MNYVTKPITNVEWEELRKTAHTRFRTTDDPVCDFCAADTPVTLFAAYRKSTGEWCDCWRWAACQRCADAIEFDDWETIEDRAATKFSKFLPELAEDELLLKLSIKMALMDFFKYAQRKD